MAGYLGRLNTDGAVSAVTKKRGGKKPCMLKFSPEKLEKLLHFPVQNNVKKVSLLALNFSEAKSEGKMIYANRRRKGKMGK